MPELPEVETIINQLKNKLVGRKLDVVKIFDSKLGTKKKYSILSNLQIITITRRGKYIVFNLTENTKLVIHLRMSGTLIVQSNNHPLPKYARASLQLFPNHKRKKARQENLVVLADPRRFATFDIVKNNSFFNKLGPEPLSNSYNTKYLQHKLIKKRISIKDLLLDQTHIAGIGNIYASEILFIARIRPQRIASSLKQGEIVRLVTATKKILKLAIKHQGTTISDYTDTEKRKGNFQNLLKVYDKETLPCPVCQKIIKKIKQRGRSTYFCSNCQK